DFIVIFLSTVKYLTSKIKKLYFNPALNLEWGYACFRFLNLIDLSSFYNKGYRPYAHQLKKNKRQNEKN
ncbi:hypothetical protein CN316_29770, partial [Bacillus cereus]